MSTTRELVSAVNDVDPSALAAEDLAAIGALLLDYIGVAARGSRTVTAEVVRQWQADQQGNSAVIGGSMSMTPEAAAMCNAVAGHSIEFDDVHNASSTHPGVVIFPVALALAANGGDEQFITAVVAGYEVMCRVGRAAAPAGIYARHLHPTAVTGSVGAAMTASVMLGLTQDQCVSALGVAATMASGSLQFLVDGSWIKRLHPGLAARSGIEAARLSSLGFVGSVDGLSGEHGVLASISDFGDPNRLLDGWGLDPLEVRRTSIKAHTCCRYNQGPIDALLALRRDIGFDGSQVRAVKVGLPSVAVPIVAEPRDMKLRPQNVVDAQFSLPFAIAVALIHGHAGLDQYDDPVLHDPMVLHLMEAVTAEADPAIDAYYPAQWRAWVRVELNDGRTVSTRIDDPKGDPTNPLSADELGDKFLALTRGVYDPPHQERIRTLTSRLGHEAIVGQLLAAIPFADRCGCKVEA